VVELALTELLVWV